MQLGEIPLTEDFISGNRDAVGEIETSERGHHRNSHAGIFVLEQKLLGKSRVLAPENYVAVVGIAHVGVTILRLGCKEETFSVCSSEEVVKAVVIRDIQKMPVIQPRALELFVRRRKTHRFYDVERRARNSAGSRNISRILGNVRFGEDNIQLNLNPSY